MFKLPELPYGYDALEPYIDRNIMELHHAKHHATYINNLNKVLEPFPEIQKKSLEQLLQELDKLPDQIRTAVRNNAGGDYNHRLFWKMMSPGSEKNPVGQLAHEIEQTFGSFEIFKDMFENTANSHFASGWVWLAFDTQGELIVCSTPNQDSVISDGMKPILTLDLWEHAYYLQYYNKRSEYVSSWWNIVNWEFCEEMYQRAIS